MPVSESFYAFLDTETTGTTPGRDEIVEIATILTDMDLKEISRIEMKCKIKGKCSPRAAQINGYDEAVWAKEAKPFSEWKNWLALHVPFGHVAVPVAHNVEFDWAMIYERYYKPARQFFSLAYNKVDTRALATMLRTGGIIDVPNVQLATVAEALGIKSEGRAHTALADTLVVKGIFERVLEMLRAHVVKE